MSHIKMDSSSRSIFSSWSSKVLCELWHPGSFPSFSGATTLASLEPFSFFFKCSASLAFCSEADFSDCSVLLSKCDSLFDVHFGREGLWFGCRSSDLTVSANLTVLFVFLCWLPELGRNRLVWILPVCSGFAASTSKQRINWTTVNLNANHQT